MEAEQHHYELRSRSRSRSRTPSVLNRNTIDSETIEHHYDLRSKSPERSHTPDEVTSSRRSGSRSLPNSASKHRDKNRESVVEQKEKTAVGTVVENQGKQNDSPTVTATKKAERRSERQRVKRQIFANGQNETKDDSKEKSDRRTKSLTPRRVLTSDYSSEEGEREDPPSRPGSAYEIYKQAGDWWNVFPKTDYTYSQKSQYRYEIAPGVLAMPNMSRRSIHSDSNSTSGSISVSQQNLSKPSTIAGESYTEDMTDIGETRNINQDFLSAEGDHLFSHERSNSLVRAMIYKTTHVEHFKSHRETVHLNSGESLPIEEKHDSYLTWSHSPLGTITSRRYGHVSQVDSDTELDNIAVISANRNNRWRIVLWFQRLTVIITTWYTTMINYIGLRKARRQYTSASYDYRRYQESIWSRAWRPIDRVLQQLYLLLVNILFLDTWLLSRVSSVRKQIQKRRSKILWIVLLLPLLVLAGWWFLPYILSISPFNSIVEMVRRTEKEVSADTTKFNIHREELIRKSSLKEDDLRMIVAILTDRIERLEDSDKMQINKFALLEKRLVQEEENINNIKLLVSDIKFEFQSLRKLYLRLRSCDASMKSIIIDEIKKHVEQVSKQSITEILENLIVINNNAYSQKVDIKEDSPIKEVERSMKPVASMSSEDTEVGGTLTKEDIREIVKQMLKIYDADKTGRVDYALESAGGQIISTRCTQHYNTNTRAFKLMGFTLYYDNINPRIVIQRNPMQPGVCWVFQDFPGYLLIKLRSLIYVTGFTMEHASRSILPNGEMKSAPRKFNVWGLKSENDREPVLFGDYEFIDSDDNLQYFPVMNTTITIPYEYVELKIHSNHGQLNYTCLYRFRVHGVPV